LGITISSLKTSLNPIKPMSICPYNPPSSSQVWKFLPIALICVLPEIPVSFGSAAAGIVIVVNSIINTIPDINNIFFFISTLPYFNRWQWIYKDYYCKFGKVGTEYVYGTYTIDLDDDVYYWIDWGDGTNSGWLGPHASGEPFDEIAKHKWRDEGAYTIKAKAKDTNNAESLWSEPLSVTMPKDRATHKMPLFLRFLQNHPNLFPMLRQLLGL